VELKALEGGEDEDVAGFGGGVVAGDFVAGRTRDLAADFEDGAGAVADVEIALVVEGDAGGDAEAFGVGGDLAGGGDAIDGAFGAGADVEVAEAIEGEAGGVEELADEGADLEVAVDGEDADGNLLATGAGEGGEDAAVGVDGGVGDGVKIFGHGNGDADGQGVRGLAVAVEDEVAGDAPLRDANDGAGGAREG